MFSMPLLVLMFIVLGLLSLHFYLRRCWLYYRIEKIIPGPKPLPILGNSLSFGNAEDSYNQAIAFSKAYNRFYRIYVGHKVAIVLYHYRDVETLLCSNVKVEKSWVYNFLFPWIGTGLLTSSGPKWKSRRKMITPAFHFKVLEPYIDLFNANGDLLCKILAENVGKEPFDVHKPIKLYALDNICETAMRTKINALVNSESEYVKAIKEMASLIVHRAFNFLLFSDLIYYNSNYGKREKAALTVIHETTKRVIRERRKEILLNKGDPAANHDAEDMDFGQKKKMAFLDILLTSAEGFALSDEDICEEVSTFMFEGHDTVSSGIAFALYSLANNPEVQEIAYQEQLAIFGDSDRPPSNSDVQEMKYLDMVLKETQRLYPSVPMISRLLNEDLQLSDGYVLPKGAQATIFISQLHRDPNVWPDPEKFNPDNFLPEAVEKRSPFSYVPFSAGARNCIGQRFAIIEMKSCISKVLRNFKLLPSCRDEHKLAVYGELVMVSKTGMHLQVEKRK